MLDLKFIKDNADAVKTNIKNRNMKADVDKMLSLYDARNEQLTKVSELRQKRNKNADMMKQKLSPEERQRYIDEGKELKELIAKEEEALVARESELLSAARSIPNMAHPDAPVGKEDKDNTELLRVGKVPQFDFKPKDHVEIAESLGIIDFETGTKVAGTKFYYLINEGALLEMALSRFAMDRLKEKGFKLIITPDIAKEEILEGIGFNPRGEESNIYPLEDTGTCLVGTAEITLGGYYADQIVDLSNGPIKLAGLSHCFRREAGAAGQYSKGLYRVHQFSKVEMFVLCKPEESDAMHEQLREIEQEIFSSLEIPFRVVDTCTGDLGAPAYRKYDLEAWMPGRGDAGDWGEITSTSNCTDYQSRRLKVRYKDGGETRYVHMLNGTAIAISRAIISILENFQNADGSVTIPERLRAYTGFDRIG